MQAWIYTTTTGGLEKNLHLDASARVPPAPRGNEVIVKVLTASLNPADYKVPELGFLVRMMLIGTPATPGMDFCGRIVSTGPLANHLKEGTLVYGFAGRPVQFGSLAEYMAVGADKICVVPDGVKIDEAAAVGATGLTAYQSLAHVMAGDKVLINGGSGGCGVFGIQIAKAMGCHVTTTCSTRNMELCLRLGADAVIDYTAEKDLIGKLAGNMFDHVVDNVGLPSDMYYQCHRFLKEEGTFVQIGAVSMMTFVSRMCWPAFLGGGQRKYMPITTETDLKRLGQLGEWIAEGTIKVQLDSVFDFGDAIKAFEKLRLGRARGKIVVHVSDPDARNMESFGIGL
ncbi:hypothetical protein N7520_004136 [Penicillium odoratum]|uniref:uncharacterized protein n=1 Tax=Penicillium odoratum TaxID=1167516 RepID=UPI0025490888|nr:uncharacterized protein N7520_004136 [Penicillium odoratum]KAJ5769577.1 hypothetical protein N7520_004136 [Penicillium odoratum]